MSCEHKENKRGSGQLIIIILYILLAIMITGFGTRSYY